MKLEEGTHVRIVDETDDFSSPLSRHGVKVGDMGIISEEDDFGISDYHIDVYRDGQVIEEDLPVMHDEVEPWCAEGHKLMYHDRKEEFYCPWCKNE